VWPLCVRWASYVVVITTFHCCNVLCTGMLYCEHSTCNHGYMLICCYIKFVYLRIFQEAIKEKQEGDWSVWLSWTNLFNSTVESTIVLNIRVLYTLETVALKRLCWGYFCYKMDWFEVDTRQFETCSTPGSRNVFIFILNILVRIVCDFDCLLSCGLLAWNMHTW